MIIDVLLKCFFVCTWVSGMILGEVLVCSLCVLLLYWMLDLIPNPCDLVIDAQFRNQTCENPPCILNSFQRECQSKL